MLLDNDLLITLIMQKTTGPLQQHLRLNARNITTFTEAPEIVYSYIKSRHLVMPGSNKNDGPVDMDIGAMWKERGKGRKGKGKGMFKGKAKNLATKVKECSKECLKKKVKEKAKEKERKEKEW